MTIRRAHAEDLAVLRSLSAALIEELSSGRGGFNLRQDICNHLECDDTSLTSRLAEIASAGWVSDDGEIRGFSAWINGVGVVYVLPSARQSGVGRHLYGALASVHQAIDLWVRPGDRAAKSFGEALGLKARKLVMNEPLDGDVEEQ